MRCRLPLLILTILGIPTWLFLTEFNYLDFEWLSKSNDGQCPDLDSRITIASIQQLDYLVSCIKKYTSKTIAPLSLETKYVLVTGNDQIPDDDVIDTIQLFQPVADVLDAFGQLNQVMPRVSSNPAKPICSIVREDSTLIQSYNYSLFLNHKSELTYEDTTCYSCDLLPNMFLIRISSLVDFYDKESVSYESIGAGIQMVLALNFKAYCPSIRVTTKSVVDPTCNHLGSQWDVCFPKFAAYSKIKRIVTPQKQEAWLTCIWSHHALNYSFACHNMLHQYLLDTVSALKYLGVDHRVVDGTVLGALRHHDMIPWTPDVDVVVHKNHVRFKKDAYRKIPLASGHRFSLTDCNGNDQFAKLPFVLRLFTSCPVVQDSRLQQNKTNALSEIRFNNIREIFDGPGVVPNGHMWKDMGYVDLYFPYNLPDCYNFVNIINQPENVTMRGLNYLTYSPVRDLMECMYGTKYMEMPGLLRTFDSWYGNVRILYE